MHDEARRSEASRRQFLKLGVTAGLGSLAAAGGLDLSRRAAAAGQRPEAQVTPPRHVLFISIDDLNTHLGCYGNRVVQTPNIDRLAAGGTQFNHAYAQYPSCMPSRYSFMSGWYPERTSAFDFRSGVRNGPLERATYLGQHFRKNGYYTCRLDKVFHVGTDDYISWDVSEEPERDRPELVYLGAELRALGLQQRILRQGRYDEVSGERGPYYVMDCADEELYDGMTTTRAIKLMKSPERGDKPLFLAIGYRRPHLPWIAPARYFDLYPYDSIELPPRDPADASPYPEQKHREMIAHYYACVSFIDAQVGRLLAGLEEAGLAQQTLVVLFGDQGYCLGERQRHFGKGNLWERSLRVPLILRGPSAAAGQKHDEIVSLLDMYPTLSQACGLPDPASRLQGVSLAPLLKGQGAPGLKNQAFATWQPHQGQRQQTVRTQRYRYIETIDGEPIELFDYHNDPYEHRNLVAEKSLAAVRDELAEVVRQDRS